MAVQIQLRHDTAANWVTANPTLAQGELGVEVDARRIKIGDGTTEWNLLSYLSSNILTATATVATTSLTTIYSISSSLYRSVELNIQATQGTNYYLTKLLVLHDGTDAHITQYGTVVSGTLNVTFSANVSGGNLIIQVTQSSATSTAYKINILANPL
jgi:hypothetical protein